MSVVNEGLCEYVCVAVGQLLLFEEVRSRFSSSIQVRRWNLHVTEWMNECSVFRLQVNSTDHVIHTTHICSEREREREIPLQKHWLNQYGKPVRCIRKWSNKEHTKYLLVMVLLLRLLLLMLLFIECYTFIQA